MNMENKDMYLYIDKVGRKIKTRNMSFNQYATNVVLYVITIGKYPNITGTFKFPDNETSPRYHFMYDGEYSLEEDDTEPLLTENAGNLYRYSLQIPRTVSAMTVMSATARLNVSVSCFEYDDRTQVLKQAISANTQIIVNQASDSDRMDEGYSSTEVDNLWEAVNNQLSEGLDDRVSDLEEQIADIEQNKQDKLVAGNYIDITGNTIAVSNEIPDEIDAVRNQVLSVSANVADVSDRIDNQIGNHTVAVDVPADAVFTDTKYTSGTYISVSNDNKISVNIGGSNGLAPVARSNSYEDLVNKPDFSRYATQTEIATINGNISEITRKIPESAAEDNKLVDKRYMETYVGSQVATMGGTYKGTYDIVDDLHLSPSSTTQQVAIALDNAISGESRNDSAFVIDGSTISRYYYTGSSWQWQYNVPQAQLTPAQEAAINSGITADKVSTYDGYNSRINNVSNSAAALQTSLNRVSTSVNGLSTSVNGLSTSMTTAQNNISAIQGQIGNYTLGKSVPSNAVFTDTTYSSTSGIVQTGTVFSLKPEFLEYLEDVTYKRPEAELLYPTTTAVASGQTVSISYITHKETNIANIRSLGLYMNGVLVTSIQPSTSVASTNIPLKQITSNTTFQIKGTNGRGESFMSEIVNITFEDSDYFAVGNGSQPPQYWNASGYTFYEQTQHNTGVRLTVVGGQYVYCLTTNANARLYDYADPGNPGSIDNIDEPVRVRFTGKSGIQQDYWCYKLQYVYSGNPRIGFYYEEV